MYKYINAAYNRRMTKSKTPTNITENVTRTTIVQHLVQNAGLSKKDATAALQAFEHIIVEAIAQGQSVSMPNFLSIKIKPIPAKVGRNPRTGAPLHIAARNRVVIKPGRGIENAANPDNTK